MSETTKNLKTLLSWIASVFFLLAGVGSLAEETVSALALFALGLWLLPPLQKRIGERFSVLQSPLKRWGIGLLWFVIAVVLSPKQAVDSHQVVTAPVEQEVREVNSGTVSENTTKQMADSVPVPAEEEIRDSASPEVVLDSRVSSQAGGETKAVSVVDGDTFRLDNDETVRLIGINTPESGQPYYQEATNVLRDLVLDKVVRLERDISERDRYGRLLAYVYVGDVLVNRELVVKGLAKAYPFEPDTSKQDVFSDAEIIAQKQGVGMWTPAAPAVSAAAETESTVNVVVSAFNYDSPGNDNETMTEEYFVLTNKGSEPVDLSGYRASDAANHEYRFPDFTLAAGASVKVRTGNGTNTATDLYWGSDGAVWNNSGDTLYLHNSAGNIVLTYQY